MNDPATITTNGHGTAQLTVKQQGYTQRYGEVTKKLRIDARRNIYMILESYDPETNRTKAESISISRADWDMLKQEIFKNGGTL